MLRRHGEKPGVPLVSPAESADVENDFHLRGKVAHFRRFYSLSGISPRASQNLNALSELASRDDRGARYL